LEVGEFDIVSTSRRKLKVAICPHCGQSHEFTIELLLRTVESKDRKAYSARRQVSLICSTNGQPFLAELDIPVPANQELVEVRPLGFVAL
jgi:hypothetical protein